MNPHIICHYITNQINLLMFAHFYEHLFYFRIDISHQRLICFHSPFSLLPLAHFFHHHFLFFLSSHQLILSLLILISLCPTLAPHWLRTPLLHPLLLHPLLFLLFSIILLLLHSLSILIISFPSFPPHPPPCFSLVCLLYPLSLPSFPSSALPLILLLVEYSGVETIRRSTGIRIPALFDHQSLL